jgi:hypothetical protein
MELNQVEMHLINFWMGGMGDWLVGSVDEWVVGWLVFGGEEGPSKNNQLWKDYLEV